MKNLNRWKFYHEPKLTCVYQMTIGHDFCWRWEFNFPSSIRIKFWLSHWFNESFLCFIFRLYGINNGINYTIYSYHILNCKSRSKNLFQHVPQAGLICSTGQFNISAICYQSQESELPSCLNTRSNDTNRFNIFQFVSQ